MVSLRRDRVYAPDPKHSATAVSSSARRNGLPKTRVPVVPGPISIEEVGRDRANPWIVLDDQDGPATTLFGSGLKAADGSTVLVALVFGCHTGTGLARESIDGQLELSASLGEESRESVSLPP